MDDNIQYQIACNLLDEAYTLDDEGQSSKALAACRKVIDIINSEETPSEEFTALLAEAYTLCGELLEAVGNDDEARDAYHQALRADPYYRAARHKLRDLESRLKDRRIEMMLASVGEQLEQMVNTLGSVDDASDLSTALESLNDAIQLGKALFEKLGSKAPSELRALLIELFTEQGALLQEAGNLDEAVESYTTLLRLKPGDHQIRRTLSEIKKQNEEQRLQLLFEDYDETFALVEETVKKAHLLNDEEKHTAALEACHEAVKLGQPLYERLGEDAPLELILLLSETYGLNGEILEELDRSQEALVAYRTALEIDPKYRDAKRHVTSLESQVEERRLADIWQTYDEKFSEAERLVDEAFALSDSNQKDALPITEKAISIIEPVFNELGSEAPKDLVELLADVKNLRGELLEELDRNEEALDAYRQALHVDPSWNIASKNLGDLENKLGIDYKLTTVAVYSHPLAAQMAWGLLDAQGIWAYIADEQTLTANWLFSLAIGGVKLQVRQQDADRAKELLANAIPDEKEVAEMEKTAGEILRCPQCGSSNIEHESFNRRLTFSSWLLLGFPLRFHKDQWVCRNCTHRWQNL